jgi:hypothetical protein
MSTVLSLVTFSIYVFPIYGQVSLKGTNTWLDRENNIKILFTTMPQQPTIGTPTTLRFTVQNLQTGKPVTNLLANVAILGGASNEEAIFRLTNISAVNGDFSTNVIFPNKGSYQLITKITSQTHDSASLLASFIVIVPATLSTSNPLDANYVIWIGLLLALAIGVASFLILKNKS